MIRFSKKINDLLQLFLMALLISVFVSGVSTLVSVGAVNKFWFDLWYWVWGILWLFAFPTLILVMPFIKKAASQFAKAA